MSDSTGNENYPSEEPFLLQWAAAWNQFWFRPSAPQALAVIRILTGLMVLYSHAVWTLEFDGFIGEKLLSADYRANLFQNGFESTCDWSHFDWLPQALWMPAHVLGLLAVACFVVGWQTKFFSWITAALVISYANRATGALFGLDQILAFLTLYLAVGNCGDTFSVDRWWKSRKHPNLVEVQPSSWNSIATRLIQIHLCVVYLFAGLGKCQGDTWWNGEALWGALASYEYQTVDMTFMADQMTVVAALTLLTLFWEVGYAALIWPKLTRPIMLTLAIPMHLGIGICMGMMTFGLVMLIANLSFVSPGWFRRSTHGPETLHGSSTD
jgi:hypothetical protein